MSGCRRPRRATMFSVVRCWTGSTATANRRDSSGDQVDERTDFLGFIFRKGTEFERAVVQHLRGLHVAEMRAVSHRVVGFEVAAGVHH